MAIEIAISKEHIGKWIAIDPGLNNIIYSANGIEEAVQAAENQGINEPVIIYVPDIARSG